MTYCPWQLLVSLQVSKKLFIITYVQWWDDDKNDKDDDDNENEDDDDDDDDSDYDNDSCAVGSEHLFRGQ